MHPITCSRTSCHHPCKQGSLHCTTVSKEGANIWFLFEILNIQTFSCYSIKYSKICSYINEYGSNIFLHVLHRKFGPGWSLTFWLNYEKDYDRQTTHHLSYIVYIILHIHIRLDYKITNSPAMQCHRRPWPLCVAYRNIGIVSRGLLLAISG